MRTDTCIDMNSLVIIFKIKKRVQMNLNKLCLGASDPFTATNRNAPFQFVFINRKKSHSPCPCGNFSSVAA